jgi:hypothetical protein
MISPWLPLADRDAISRRVQPAAVKYAVSRVPRLHCRQLTCDTLDVQCVTERVKSEQVRMHSL